MSIAITATGLGKAYRKRGLAARTLFGALTGAGRREETFWAVRNASFDIRRGATVGVIGPNGAGKSSLLGLTAGTINPTEGSIRAEGRISALLELGAGFHPDLTGRENVYLNAALLGIPREDIRRRFDAIVDFAGLREFIDTPVKNYSSGMYVRLGFAVATEVDPDILLVDEVLAVGDLQFQVKCLERIRDFKRRGKTLLFVSHALTTVEEFCDEVMLIDHGKLVQKGEPADTILNFVKNFAGAGDVGGLLTQQYGTRDAEITSVRLLDETGAEISAFPSGRRMTVEIRWKTSKRIDRPVFGYNIKTAGGLYVYGTNTQIAGFDLPFIDGTGVTRLHLDPLALRHGNYFLSLSLHSWDHQTQYHRIEDAYPFGVRNTDPAPGLVTLPTRWEVGS